MYVQGVSTRKVKAITEELCGHEFSSATVSRVNETLDGELAKFAERWLDEDYPYLILDARYEKVREDGVVRSQAVQVAIGINQEGRRCVLAVGLANRESTSSWRDFLQVLKQRGLRGVEFVVSDDHEGLKECHPGGAAGSGWQLCLSQILFAAGRLTCKQMFDPDIRQRQMDKHQKSTVRLAIRNRSCACRAIRIGPDPG